MVVKISRLLKNLLISMVLPFCAFMANAETAKETLQLPQTAFGWEISCNPEALTNFFYAKSAKVSGDGIARTKIVRIASGSIKYEIYYDDVLVTTCDDISIRPLKQ